MDIPFNMTTPRLKLADGEQILESYPGMRRKGIFGNRYGILHLTNRRLAFVKAIMKSGPISAAMNAKGVKPMLEFDLSVLGTMEKVATKKQLALVIAINGKTETFTMTEERIDALLTRAHDVRRTS